MRLEIETRQTKPGMVTMLLEGSLDGETHETLHREILRLMAESPSVIVLDMDGVEYISSAGVGALASAKTSVTKEGGELAMTNLQPQVAKVLEIMRLVPVLGVFKNQEELDEYLGRIQRRMTGEED
ncbi:MAG: STAS domain-containing protein [Phycisphaerales bacterium]|nr:MAG: STAS domain-containing protein [Phycisphaerales bacterium]